MIRPLVLVILVLATCAIKALANDGAYTGSGSSLTPVQESQISIRKELLTIKRIGRSVLVTVNYEMYNPGREKTLTVGFEGSAPYGDVSISPVNGEHPYITNFTAVVNGEYVSHEVHYLAPAEPDEEMARRKRYSLQEVERADPDDGPSVDYVYTFTAKFAPGVNTIKHSYVHRLSYGVEFNYRYDYILTAANRWANKQIDDFTLLLDMGPFESFYVPMTFFAGTAGWKIIGKGSLEQRRCFGANEDAKQAKQLRVTIESGFAEFTAKNFHPNGELGIESPGEISYRFDCKDGADECNEMDGMTTLYSLSAYRDADRMDYTPEQIKILEALPYARRGMVFNETFIQNYYEHCTDWYVRNPRYKPKPSDLLPEERSWLMQLRRSR